MSGIVTIDQLRDKINHDVVNTRLKTPITGFTLNDVLNCMVNSLEAISGGGGTSSFLGLNDTPNGFIADNFIINNSSGDGLINISPSDIGLSVFNNDIGFITGYTETDPVFTSHPANNVINTGSGNNVLSDNGNYVSFVSSETDPIFSSHPAFGVINTGNGSNVLSDNGNYIPFSPGSSSYLSLSDTPSSFVPSTLVMVNGTATSLIHVSLSSVGLSSFNNDAGFITSSDGNGIYGSSDTIPSGVVATLTDSFSFIGGSFLGVGRSTPLALERFGVEGTSSFNGVINVQGNNRLNLGASGFTSLRSINNKIEVTSQAGLILQGTSTNSYIDIVSSSLDGNTLNLFNNSNFFYKESGTVDASEFLNIGNNLSYFDIENQNISIGKPTSNNDNRFEIHGLSSGNLATTNALSVNSTTKEIFLVRDSGFVSVNGAAKIGAETFGVNGFAKINNSLGLNSSVPSSQGGINVPLNSRALAFGGVTFLRHDDTIGIIMQSLGTRKINFDVGLNSNLMTLDGTSANLRSLILNPVDSILTDPQNETNIIFNSSYWNGTSSQIKSSSIIHNIINPPAGTSKLDFLIENTSILSLLDNGYVGIGLNNPTSRLHVKGEGATFLTNSMLVENSLGNQSIKIQDDSTIELGFNSTTIGKGIVTINNTPHSVFEGTRIESFINNISDEGISVQTHQATNFGNLRIKPYSPVQSYHSIRSSSGEEIRFGRLANPSTGRISISNTTNTLLLGINNHNPFAALDLKGNSNVANSNTLLVSNSDGTIDIRIRGNNTINTPNLPTNSSGLTSGDWWRDGNDLKIF